MRANGDTFDLIVVLYGFVNETNLGTAWDKSNTG